MKNLCLFVIVSALLVMVGCESVDRIGPVTLPHTSESSDRFIQRESARIQEKWKELQQRGHVGEDANVLPHPVLGEYGWHGTGKGYFGAYSFSAPAFAQAKENWWIHGQIAKGTNLLRSVATNVRFDESVIGHNVGGIYMRENGAFLEGAKVAAVVDAQTVRLDRTAENDGEQYNLAILSPHYQDMCNCTSNFSPFGGE